MAPVITRSNSGKNEETVAEEYGRRRKAVEELKKERKIRKRIMMMNSPEKEKEKEKKKEEEKKKKEEKKLPIVEKMLKLYNEALGYTRQVRESEGFDVDLHIVPKTFHCRTVIPLTPDDILKFSHTVTPLCNAAIHFYNTTINKKKMKKKKNADADADADAELEFHKIAYATYERLLGALNGYFYLTFYATPKNNQHLHGDDGNNNNNQHDDDDQVLKSKLSPSHLILQAKVYRREPSKFGDDITTVEFCRIKAPPTVKRVRVVGNAVVGSIISGGGHYVGGQEGPSKFEWFRLDPHTRERVLMLTGSTTYHLTEEDVGHHLVFKYTPLNSLGQVGKPKSRWSQLVWREKNVPFEAEMFSNNELRNKMKTIMELKLKTPVDIIILQTRDLLMYVDRSNSKVQESEREEKMMELSKTLRELKSILYGNSESEPVLEACAQLTQEFFRENTLRLLITCLPKLNLETRKVATQVVVNLQRQQVQSQLIDCDYLEKNIDLIDILVSGYENTDIALHCGAMLRECIRHQSVAKYVLESEHMKKFFDFIQLPNFDIAADVAATFKELCTRHKSIVAEFLAKKYDWFFAEYNSKLLESPNYITRRQAIKLLGDMLLDRTNSAVMLRYVSSSDNLRILMNLLRESRQSIQIEAFPVFKLFAANQNKPADVISILVANRSMLLHLFADFKTDTEDEQFEADKAQFVREMASLEPQG